MPKEYIEREAFYKTLEIEGKRIGMTVCNRLNCKEIARATPATDVVEVVRCKNCKWSMELTESEERIYTNDCVMCAQIHPDRERIVMLRDDFCSYGERREES